MIPHRGLVLVTFSDLGEFVTELTKEPMGQEIDPFVRLTCEFKESKSFAGMRHVSVVCGRLRNTPPICQLLELRIYTGQAFGDAPGGKDAHNRAERLVEDIEKRLSDIGVQARPGLYRLPPHD